MGVVGNWGYGLMTFQVWVQELHQCIYKSAGSVYRGEILAWRAVGDRVRSHLRPASSPSS
jgi:hypothetical protein